MPKSAEKTVSVLKLRKTQKKHQGCCKLLISIRNKGKTDAGGGNRTHTGLAVHWILVQWVHDGYFPEGLYKEYFCLFRSAGSESFSFDSFFPLLSARIGESYPWRYR
jgi:hypothetical protein